MPATKDNVELKSGLPQKVTASSPQKCWVEEVGDAAIVSFRIDPQEWARMKRRIANQDPSTFMWENHIHRMISAAVY